MAKRSTKFGTFGGVFTPSILTILGVIMYLRLPWVVGNGGLWTALGVVLAAHVISVSTGLSISSIATDKKVGAGGPYYIVSRSLGLPIGGTLGLALFVGLSFSISLYVIGFSESFLAFLPEAWGLGTDIHSIRVCGTITVCMLTIVTLISTSFAIRTQYVILGLIGLSLIAIALTPAVPEVESIHLTPPEGGASLAEIFGIFFPAVTGFTAGVNMSGDLRDPKKSIPVGTLASISVGFLVYMSLAVFLAWKIPVSALLDNTNILAESAWRPIYDLQQSVFGGGEDGGPPVSYLVLLGIWGATLSSGLGSIMGAPRILQALSGDRVTPTWFAKGHGRDNEPRRALLIAFAIGEAGILIGELDVIARVVSIFFIATYGFLNLSCAIESWASTDFRPEFRIPRTVSVVGALACVLIMIQLDIQATAAAAVLFALLFAWLKRRELALESGDTWEGVWSSLVRWGLEQLDAGGSEQRNWRPNVLSFSWRELQDHGPLLAFGTEIIRDRGLLTDVRLRTPKDERRASKSGTEGASPSEGEEEGEELGDAPQTLIAGRFEREIETEDPWATARDLARFHGFAGLEPNTVLINWAEHRHDRQGFAETLDELSKLDFNLVLLARDVKRGFGRYARIDLWWTPTQGSFELEMALLRFLTLSDDWRRAQLRFLLLNDDPSRSDALFKSAQRALDEARIQASVKVLNNAIGNRPLYDWVRQESMEADLVVLDVPEGPLAKHPERITELDQLCDDIGSVLVIRGAGTFEPVLQRVEAGKKRNRVLDLRSERSLSADELDAVDLVPLRAPEPLELKAAARELSLTHDELAREFHEDCLALIYEHDAALITQLRGVVERAFDQLGKALREPVGLRQRKQLNKVQSSFLFQARRALAEFEDDRLSAQVDALEHRVEGWVAQLDSLERDAPKLLTANREPAALELAPEDEPSLRRAKRALRRRNALKRDQISYSFNPSPLYAHYLRYRSRALLETTLEDMALDGYQMLLELGRSISEARHALDEFAVRLVELPASRPAHAEPNPEPKPERKPEPEPELEPEPEPTSSLFAPPKPARPSPGTPSVVIDGGSMGIHVEVEEGTPEASEAEASEPGAGARERAKRELAARIAERRELVLERLSKLLARIVKRSEQSRDLLLHGSRSLAQGFANDIDSLEVQALVRQRRRLPPELEGLDERLQEAAGVWRRNRQLVLNRAALELHNAGFQQRLRAIVTRTKDSTAQAIASGALAGTTQLREALAEYRGALEQDLARGPAGEASGELAIPKLRAGIELRGEFDDKRVVEDLAGEAQAASAELPDAIEVIGDDALLQLQDHPFEETEVLTVSLRRLVDFLVQAEFLGGLREHTARVALAEQRALGVAQEVLHLVSFNLSEYEHEHELDDPDHESLELAERMGPVIDNGLGRLDAELEQLRALAPGLAERIDAQLGKILDRTEAYAITGSEDSFKLYVRHEQSASIGGIGGIGAIGALSKVGGATRWAQGLSRRMLVDLLYRRSAESVEARAAASEGAQRHNTVERVLEFVNANSPRPEVLDALPFFYSQPFLGQARASSEYWVGREAELGELDQAVRNWKQRGGALMIIGERHSGKSSLARYFASKQFEKRNKYSILAPRGGSAELGLFKARLEKELGGNERGGGPPSSGTPARGLPLGRESIALDWDDILSRVPTGSVIMIHDLELWWERSPGGERVVEQLLELIERWGERLLFIIELNAHAFGFISRSLPLADRALSVVECRPFAAEQLKELIEVRHRSTGLRLRVDERDEDELAAYGRARLFTRYVDYTGGYVGVALQSWITHIERVDSEVLHMRTPSPASRERLDELRLEWVALLLQLVLHKRLTRARLARISGFDERAVARELDALARMGLISEDKQGVIEINRFVQHLVVDALRERGYL